MQTTTNSAVASVADIGEIVSRIDGIAGAIATAIEQQTTVTGCFAISPENPAAAILASSESLRVSHPFSRGISL